MLGFRIGFAYIDDIANFVYCSTSDVRRTSDGLPMDVCLTDVRCTSTGRPTDVVVVVVVVVVVGLTAVPLASQTSTA